MFLLELEENESDLYVDGEPAHGLRDVKAGGAGSPPLLASMKGCSSLRRRARAISIRMTHASCPRSSTDMPDNGRESRARVRAIRNGLYLALHEITISDNAKQHFLCSKALAEVCTPYHRLTEACLSFIYTLWSPARIHILRIVNGSRFAILILKFILLTHILTVL